MVSILGISVHLRVWQQPCQIPTRRISKRTSGDTRRSRRMATRKTPTRPSPTSPPRREKKTTMIPCSAWTACRWGRRRRRWEIRQFHQDSRKNVLDICSSVLPRRIPLQQPESERSPGAPSAAADDGKRRQQGTI